MVSISLNTSDNILFSSDIPKLAISVSDYGQYTVDICQFNDGAESLVFSTSVYVAGFLIFDIRSIIIPNMEASRLTAQTYRISVAPTDGSTEPDYLDITVIYSRGRFGMSAQDYSSNFFLSLMDTKLLPKYRAFDSLSAVGGNADLASVSIDYKIEGQSYTLELDIEPSPQSSNSVSRFDIDFDSLLFDHPDATPVSAVVSAGNRSMRYYFISHDPSAAVSFLNNFNAPEHFWMFGEWKRSGKVARSVATSQAENFASLISIEHAFELTTHPLAFRHTYIIPEIVFSPVIWVYLFAQGSPLSTAAFRATPLSSGSALAASVFKAVPEEGSLEVSPQIAQPTQYTIKVRSIDIHAALGYDFQIPRIFTHQFDNPFV